MKGAPKAQHDGSPVVKEAPYIKGFMSDSKRLRALEDILEDDREAAKGANFPVSLKFNSEARTMSLTGEYDSTGAFKKLQSEPSLGYKSPRKRFDKICNVSTSPPKNILKQARQEVKDSKLLVPEHEGLPSKPELPEYFKLPGEKGMMDNMLDGEYHDMTPRPTTPEFSRLVGPSNKDAIHRRSSPI